ncbi:Ribosomal RNA small subunit methyltransferase G [Candidatus Desulfarcum epimagneticum]|uniref:Ribosomal RNA small subunit methyltransferase G n=1 Tax=uncultured Desulfobacteraceae bacterium TaxID=218296 RepID=A0A484HHI7_9BACT|nr:Ribosomal RNA small subunit methyltransferase G [uncultured Desulfobacteraceae bacterium]
MKNKKSGPRKGSLETGSKRWRELILDGAERMGAPLDGRAAGLFAIHARELSMWNKKINLTAISDPLETAVKHFIDSIAAADLFPEGARLLDMGSGGGFPGLALKAARPDLSVTLLDASMKKTHFLSHVIRQTGLGDVRAAHGRAEDLAGDDSYKGRFDAVVCRAFSSLPDIWEKGAPFLSKNGRLTAWKGKNGESEAKEFLSGLSDMGAGGDEADVRIKKYRLPFLDLERALVLILKGR